MVSVPCMSPPEPHLDREGSSEGLARAGEVGRRITRARQAAKLTQAQLAHLMQVDRRTAKSWEDGATKAVVPHQKTVGRLESGELGRTGGSTTGSIWVGPGCELLWVVEDVLDLTHGSLTEGVYNLSAEDHSLEARILSDTEIDNGTKTVLLRILQTAEKSR